MSPPDRPFRSILRQLRANQQVTSNPKTSMLEGDFRDSVYAVHWGHEVASQAYEAWPLFVGVLLCYNPADVRTGVIVDWEFVKKEVAAKSKRGPFIPTWRPHEWCTEVYNERVHPLVLAWLDEVEAFKAITGDQVGSLDKRFETLYSLDTGGFFYVARDVNDADVQALFQLLELTQSPPNEHLHQEIEHCANVQNDGTSKWVLHLAESPVLRRAARDLPPNAAQCLMLIIKNALTSDHPGNPKLIKLLQDVSSFSNTFPQYLGVRNVHQNVFGRFFASGSEGTIQRIVMGSESAVVKSPRYSPGEQPSKHEMWINRQIQTRSLVLWSQLFLMGVEGVVPLLGVCVDEREPYDLQLCPVMPECVPASKWLVREDNLRRYRAFVHLLMGIANALKSLQEHDVTHGDLHWENVLLKPNSPEDYKPTVLLCDFGMMRLHHRSGPNSTSTAPRTSLKMPFAAPELIKLHEQGTEVRPERPVDVYAFGKIIYTLLTAKDPPIGALEDNPPKDLAAVIGGRKARALWAVVKQMTAEDPQQRPPMADSSLEANDGVITNFRNILADFLP